MPLQTLRPWRSTVAEMRVYVVFEEAEYRLAMKRAKTLIVAGVYQVAWQGLLDPREVIE